MGENKDTTNEYRYFLESNFLAVNRSFILVHSDQDVNSERFKTRRYCIIKSYNIAVHEKNFYDKAVGSDIKR